MLKINLKKIAEDLIPSFYEAGIESIKLSGKNLKITQKMIREFIDTGKVSQSDIEASI